MIFSKLRITSSLLLLASSLAAAASSATYVANVENQTNPSVHYTGRPWKVSASGYLEGTGSRTQLWGLPAPDKGDFLIDAEFKLPRAGKRSSFVLGAASEIVFTSGSHTIALHGRFFQTAEAAIEVAVSAVPPAEALRMTVRRQAGGHDFNTILCQANGILNVGDETRIYHGRWRNSGRGDALKHYSGEVALATLPRDRWGALALQPGAKEGAVWSALVTFDKTGCKVTLNADGVQGMSVEIADERFGLLPEYSGDNAGRITAKDGLDCAVKWPQASLDALAGRTVGLRIQLKKGEHTEPRFYAAYVSVE